MGRLFRLGQALSHDVASIEEDSLGMQVTIDHQR